MSILKPILLVPARIAFFGLLKAALFIYILTLPDTPHAVPDSDGFKGAVASNAAGARLAPENFEPHALSS
ncbi:MAG: hypothetical protein J2P49_01850 [Methylocapsa sp.]|nr:hypothetical protein [Methylocapsa sp.]